MGCSGDREGYAQEVVAMGAKLATTSWLIVSFGEPGMGLFPAMLGIDSKWTCWRLLRHLLPLCPAPAA